MLLTAADLFCKVFSDKHSCVHVCMYDPVCEDHSGASTQKAGLFTLANFCVSDIIEQSTVLLSKSMAGLKDRTKIKRSREV